MPKLFVALDLPSEVTAELECIRPPRVAGVRLVRATQMHVTLHFIGNAHVARVVETLQRVTVPPCALTFEEVGQFPSAGDSVTLWAGIRLRIQWAMVAFRAKSARRASAA